MTPREVIGVADSLWPASRETFAKAVRIPKRRFHSWVHDDGHYGEPTPEDARKAVAALAAELKRRADLAAKLMPATGITDASDSERLELDIKATKFMTTNEIRKKHGLPKLMPAVSTTEPA